MYVNDIILISIVNFYMILCPYLTGGTIKTWTENMKEKCITELMNGR